MSRLLSLAAIVTVGSWVGVELYVVFIEMAMLLKAILGPGIS